jgi:hypothetical protein
VLNLVFDIKAKIQTEGIGEQGAEKNISNKEG